MSDEIKYRVEFPEVGEVEVVIGTGNIDFSINCPSSLSSKRKSNSCLQVSGKGRMGELLMDAPRRTLMFKWQDETSVENIILKDLASDKILFSSLRPRQL